MVEPTPLPPRRRRPSPAALAGWGLAAALLFAALVALGVWQVERRAWKLDLIARVEARVHAAPVAAPGPAEWPRLMAGKPDYLHIVAHGRFRHDRETLVQAVSDYGAGYWVLTPLETSRGFTLLVNRGFVPPERKAAATRAAGQVPGEVTVTGLLRTTEPKGGFLQSNDPAHDAWHSRDVAAIAAKRGLVNAAPYFVDADAAKNPGGYPIGGLTVIRFANNHLMYAITWFGLAAMVLLGMALAIRTLRRP